MVHQSRWPAPVPPRPRSGLALTALLLSYPVFFLFPPVSALILTALCFARSVRLFGIGLLLSPFLVLPLGAYTWGAISYFTGTAVLKGVGLPPRDFWNLDPRWRCHRTTSG